MSDLHPHWQATDDEAPVPVRVKGAAAPSVSAGVSRAPAAVVGILAIAAIGFFAYGGMDVLTGQIATPTPDVTIRITQDGPVPPSAEIRPGQTIRFLNEDQIPHVLTSETLPTDDGQPFGSPGLFTNEDYFYTVPPTAQAGTHEYISETEEDVSGEIVIVTEAAAASSSSSSSDAIVLQPASSAAPLPVSSAPAFPTSVGSPIFPTSTPLPTPTSSGAPFELPGSVIAVNPHVVGTRGQSSSRRPGVTEHRPTTTAESGPALWIVGALSVAGILIVTRQAFRKV